MKHTGTKELETDRLVLRQFKLDDAEAMYSNWANDPEVTKYLTWPAHSSAEVSKSVLKDWVSQYEKTDYYQWAISLKANGNEPIGCISVVHKEDKLEMVHIGYCIGVKWWKKGITSEALDAVMAYFFDEVGVNRVESRHDPNNANSGKVMMKCGMKYEGTMREADWSNQGICDASLYAMLKKDYRLR